MIEIRNIDKTPLNKVGLIKLIRRYAKGKKDILLSFDGRISCFGDYNYNSEKKRHEIRVSTKVSQFKQDPAAKIYDLISTILHELKHLQQQEEVGTKTFYSKHFSYNTDIKLEEASDYFSVREAEARTFEEKNLLDAVNFYWKSCKDVVG